MMVGITNIPTMNHITSVAASTPIVLSITTASKLLLVAILDSSTISTTAMISSRINMLVAPCTNRSLLHPASSTAFITIVVLDIHSIAARNIEFMLSKPDTRPTPYPNSSMPTTIVATPTKAVLPLSNIFFNLNSRPMQNSTNSTPISPHAFTFSGLTMFSPAKFGPTKIPATM